MDSYGTCCWEEMEGSSCSRICKPLSDLGHLENTCARALRLRVKPRSKNSESQFFWSLLDSTVASRICSANLTWSVWRRVSYRGHFRTWRSLCNHPMYSSSQQVDPEDQGQLAPATLVSHTQQWMVYSGKSYEDGWFGGTRMEPPNTKVLWYKQWNSRVK